MDPGQLPVAKLRQQSLIAGKSYLNLPKRYQEGKLRMLNAVSEG